MTHDLHSSPVGLDTGAWAFPTEFSASIVTAVDTDYLLDGSGNSKCIDMVRTAAAQPGISKRLAFFPTLFWWDSGPTRTTLAALNNCQGKSLEDEYCYNRFNATQVEYFCYQRNSGSCTPMDAGQIARFRDR